MANIEKAAGFLQGFQASLADARQRKMQEEDRAIAKDSLAAAKQREQTLNQRQDIQWQQSQQDRQTSLADAQTAKQQQQAALAAQAEKEGMGHVLDAIDAGGDPNQVMNLYNQTGQHKLKSLSVDPNTGQFTMVGDGGATFTGTTDQVRAALGIGGGEKPIALADGGMLVTPKGKVLRENPKTAAQKSEFKEFDPTKDVYKINPDGTRTLVTKGTPKADGEAGGPGGRKVSPFNPETYSKEAADVVGKYYQGVYDPKTGMFSFDPGTRDKATYGIALAGQLARHFNGKVTAQEAGQYAAQVSAEIPTEDEAKAQAAREIGKNATPAQIEARTTKIQRAARVIAAQKLDEYMQQMDDLIAAQEQEQAGKNGNKGTRPPLDSFNR